ILHAYLQRGGRPAFEARVVLAATLSPSYGLYSGYESCENVPVQEGSEEYLNSEKYEVKQRTLDGELLPLVRRLNLIRRENPALQHLDNITFVETENTELLGFVKRRGRNTVFVVVNLDPHAPREGVAVVPAAHEHEDGVVVRAYRPDASSVRVLRDGEEPAELEQVDRGGIFEGVVRRAKLPLRYRLEVTYPGGNAFTFEDPYSFLPTLGELD